jgi:hypothetical protein
VLGLDGKTISASGLWWPMHVFACIGLLALSACTGPKNIAGDSFHYIAIEGAADNIDKLFLLSERFYNKNTGELEFYPDSELFSTLEDISPYSFLLFCKSNPFSESSIQKGTLSICSASNMEALSTYILYETSFYKCLNQIGLNSYSNGEDYDAVTSCILSRSGEAPAVDIDDISRRLIWRFFAASTTMQDCSFSVKNGSRVGECLAPVGTEGWFTGLPKAVSDERFLSAVSTGLYQYRSSASTRHSNIFYSVRWLQNQCNSRRPWATPNPISKSELILCEIFKYNRER